MTNNHSPIAALATAMLDNPDCLDMIELLRPIMTPTDFYALCAMTDICPIHLTDLDTCADDDLDDCRDFR
jgi:hypothetical protein